MPSLDLWQNLLRVLDERDAELSALPELVRLSKRAVRTRVATAVRRGWVEQEMLGRGRKVVRLTVAGVEAARRWKTLERNSETRWRQKVGAAGSDRLRAILERTVAGLELEHPHYPASYGSADASITGGNGQDWKPVIRKEGSAVSTLPISALVSQALVAFSIDYERMSPVALALSARIIMRIPAEGRLVKELGDPVGVSALLRHGFLRVSHEHRGITALLTARGESVRDQYEQRMRAVEADWSKRFGIDTVAQLRESLEEATRTNS